MGRQNFSCKPSKSSRGSGEHDKNQTSMDNILAYTCIHSSSVFCVIMEW